MSRPSGKPATETISAAVAQLQLLISKCRELDPATLKSLSEKIDQVRSIVDAPPTTLAEGGVGSLSMLQEADVGGEGTDPATMEAAFEPGERDILEKDWMMLCWFARHDMCEEEMLVLTEKTFRRLVACYGVANPENCVRFWQYLVKLRQENKRIQSACKSDNGSKPRERNAGDVVTASAAASQRTKALPTGISSGVYSPEVLSPTAQLWAKAPTERAASLRRSTERATSAAGGAAKSGSPSGRRSAGGDGASTSPASVRSGKRVGGNLKGTDSVNADAVVDAKNPNAARREFGKGYRNPNGWNRW